MQVPPRWIGCPRKGALVAGKFLPFKTPLDSRYDERVNMEDRWQLPLLIAYLKARTIKLGMIIDLTKSGRFYDSKELEQYGIVHHKLACAGHEQSPTPEQVEAFHHVCRQFFSLNPDSVIGVHCTHGFNRTGFMIASYMYLEDGSAIEAAVQQFAKARPPGILKEHYLQDLCQRYDGDTSMCVAPELPDWFYEDNETPNQTTEDALTSPSDGAGGNRQPVVGANGKAAAFPRKRKHSSSSSYVSVPMEGLESVMSVTENVEELQARLCELCRATSPNLIFPGAQPVSLDRDTIKYFEKKPYRVSWKADGTRYLMMILGPTQVYLFDRKMMIYHVPQVAFPGRASPHVKDTVVDGELVFDNEGGRKVPRFLMYDFVTFQGHDIGKLSHPDRQNAIRHELLKPRDEAERAGRLNKSKEPFRTRIKEFWDIERTESTVFEKIIPLLNHPNDGLIFSPAMDPYKLYTNHDVLKWKPPELNSIDFQLKIVKENRLGELPTRVGELHVLGHDMRVSTIKLTKELKVLHNAIIECCIDNGQWSFMRTREDKDKPNSYTTYESVCKSLTAPVTKAMLIDFIAKRRFKLPPQQSHSAPHRPPTVQRQPPTQQQLEQQQLMPPPPQV
ncbi:mRNA-capping enzyme-like [Sycon ciliatum]|uniref:mRNA-capping enzyme-like n=1 Tax=Sycon ciliatum TaxID=27933 RepID=UPI0031F71B8F